MAYSYASYSNQTNALRNSKCAKYFEYLMAVHKTRYDIDLSESHYLDIMDFLGKDGLNLAVEAMNAHGKNLSKTEIGKVFNAPNLFVSWQGINELFDVDCLLPAMLEYAYNLQTEANLLHFSEAFEKRFGILANTLNLDEVSQDILTAMFAIAKDPMMDDLNCCVMEAFEGRCSRHDSFRHRNENFNENAIAVLTGHSREKIIDTLHKNRGLMDLGIIDEDGSLPMDVVNFLTGLGSDNFLESYAKIDGKEALPLERFDCKKESEIICSLIKSYKGNRNLNFLFYGTEGTGKTELARSIAAQTGRTLYEVGLELGDDHEIFDGREHKEGTISYRIRALKISEMNLRESNALLVVDEADLILNRFEKGVLNRLLENLRLPVIWITNSLYRVEGSTMRRFQYSVGFDLGNQSIRKKLWDSVVEKHNAQSIFPPERRMELAEKYEVSTGGIELAVQNEMALSESGMHSKIGDDILENHVELLGLKTNKQALSRALKYDVSVLNISHLDEVLHSAKLYSEKLKSKQTESNMTMLLYGPPGTGKTEFARFLARECGLSFREISYGQISSMWVGQTEKQLAAAFKQANEAGELLFIDEADSLIADRKNAIRSWEVTQTNEFLVQLESAKCMVICSTNFEGHLDAASNRRFHFQLQFGFLKKDGILTMAKNFFPDLEHENWSSLASMETLAPGDFYAVYKRLQWLPKEELSLQRVAQELEGMANAKDAFGGRRLGF
jgi:SpoVK/Ycf46/Vps4 family AAA+-type ATPase